MAEITGTSSSDNLHGTNAADNILGLASNDTLWGSPGADYFNGGSGIDTVVYKLAYQSITIDLGAQYYPSRARGGDAEGDLFYNVENIVGTGYRDRLTGNDSHNIIRGGAGADTIDGGNGVDRASYAYSTAGVDVDLTRTGVDTQIGGDAQGDRLISIENLTGSSHADRLLGNDLKNEISGGLGADYIDGRGGRDFVDYRGSSSVDIDLSRATQLGGHAEGDQLVNIENIRGSTAADHIVGTSGDNELIGDAGNDVLDGAGGNDLLKGMSGNDTISTHSRGFADGGAGVDTLIVQFDARDPFDGVQVYVDNTGALSSRYDSDYDPPAGYNLGAINFEHFDLTGTQWSDGLMGGSGSDVLKGGGGDDYIQGGIGDSLDGGDGRDSVELHYDPNTTTAITVDLAAGFATGINALDNFEDLTVMTGRGNDHIRGGSEGNWINTQGGDDFVQLFGHHNYADLNPGDFDDFDTYIGSDGVDQVWVGLRGNVDGGGGAEDVLGLRFYNPDAVTFDGVAETSSTGLTFHNFEQYILYREDSIAGDNIRLGLSHDFFSGAAGDDFVMGMAGNDILRGGAGLDSLAGGDGSDTLYGDLGSDDLSGGAGDDKFYFSQGYDYINDFNATEGDLIVIPTDAQDEAHDTFAEWMAAAEDTVGGLLLHSANDTASTLLIAGVTKADFTESSVEFLV